MNKHESYNVLKKIVTIVAIISIIFSFSIDIAAQKRQRSKSKAKTSSVTITKKPKTSAEAKKQQEAAQKEIKLTEQQIKDNEAGVKKGLAELGKLEQNIEASNRKIKELNGKISNLKKEISTLETGISNNEKDLEKLRVEYLKAVKKMRITKKNNSTLAFLFSSKSMNQALRRMRYLREFSAWRERQTEEINLKISDLKKQKDALATAQEEEAKALSQQKAAYTYLASQHSKQQQIVNELKSNGDALQVHLKKKQAEASELGSMVSLLIAEEQKKAAQEEAQQRAKEKEARRKQSTEGIQSLTTSNNTKKNNNTDNTITANKTNSASTDFANARKRSPRGHSSNTSNSSLPEIPGATDFPSQRGHLPYPTSGTFTIISTFGRQKMADMPDVEYDNPGIDAETDAGATARAVFNGKVSGVYLLPGYNTVVILNHDGYYTVYGNLSSSNVKNGDLVETGDNLGRLAIDEDDPQHSSIHFEVWKNREKLNPQEWLR